MAWQQSDLDTIRACIASGVLKTRFADGREVQYQSLDHLIAAERVISAQLTAAAQAAQGITRRRFARFKSGF